MISRLRYTLREMWASLSRNLTLTVAAVITSMVSLFLFGITLLIQQAFDNQLSQWTGGVQMVVYVNHNAQQDAIDTIDQALKSRPELIKNVTYCPIGIVGNASHSRWCAVRAWSKSSFWMSRIGGAPNRRRYSRLNWEGLS